jgi:DNA-binding CsgD family transcriptional regulator
MRSESLALSLPQPAPTALTERERQIVTLAAAGQHNKLIAYNLGISHSTVRVLMARAAKRISARSREELIVHYEKEAAFRSPAPPACRLMLGASCAESGEFTREPRRKLVSP